MDEHKSIFDMSTSELVEFREQLKKERANAKTAYAREILSDCIRTLNKQISRRLAETPMYASDTWTRCYFKTPKWLYVTLLALIIFAAATIVFAFGMALFCK